MDLVVDANILFSALIKEGITAELLLNERFRLFAPEFMFQEFSKHREVILRKTRRTEEEFIDVLEILQQIITVVPREKVEVFLNKASQICPDEDDVPYFALALKLNCAIWSNDKKLKEQKSIRVHSTDDLLKLFLK